MRLRVVDGQHGLCRQGTPSAWVRYEANAKRRTNFPFYRVIIFLGERLRLPFNLNSFRLEFCFGN